MLNFGTAYYLWGINAWYAGVCHDEVYSSIGTDAITGMKLGVGVYVYANKFVS